MLHLSWINWTEWSDDSIRLICFPSAAAIITLALWVGWLLERKFPGDTQSISHSGKRPMRLGSVIAITIILWGLTVFFMSIYGAMASR